VFRFFLFAEMFVGVACLFWGGTDEMDGMDDIDGCVRYDAESTLLQTGTLFGPHLDRNEEEYIRCTINRMANS